MSSSNQQIVIAFDATHLTFNKLLIFLSVFKLNSFFLLFGLEGFMLSKGFGGVVISLFIGLVLLLTDPTPKWRLFKGYFILLATALELMSAIMGMENLDYYHSNKNYAIPAIVSSCLYFIMVLQRLYVRHMELNRIEMERNYQKDFNNSNSRMTSVSTSFSGLPQ